MYTQVQKPKDNKSRAVANSVTQAKSNGKQRAGFVDNHSANTFQTIQRKNNIELPDELKAVKENRTFFSTDYTKVSNNPNSIVQQIRGNNRQRILQQNTQPHSIFYPIQRVKEVAPNKGIEKVPNDAPETWYKIKDAPVTSDLGIRDFRNFDQGRDVEKLTGKDTGEGICYGLTAALSLVVHHTQDKDVLTMFDLTHGLLNLLMEGVPHEMQEYQNQGDKVLKLLERSLSKVEKSTSLKEKKEELQEFVGLQQELVDAILLNYRPLQTLVNEGATHVTTRQQEEMMEIQAELAHAQQTLFKMKRQVEDLNEDIRGLEAEVKEHNDDIIRLEPYDKGVTDKLREITGTAEKQIEEKLDHSTVQKNIEQVFKKEGPKVRRTYLIHVSDHALMAMVDNTGNEKETLKYMFFDPNGGILELSSLEKLVQLVATSVKQYSEPGDLYSIIEQTKTKANGVYKDSWIAKVLMGK